jgi:hypothetical protein
MRCNFPPPVESSDGHYDIAQQPLGVAGHRVSGQHTKVDVNRTSESGNSALHYAACSPSPNRIKMIELLLITARCCVPIRKAAVEFFVAAKHNRLQNHDVATWCCVVDARRTYSPTLQRADTRLRRCVLRIERIVTMHRNRLSARRIAT